MSRRGYDVRVEADLCRKLTDDPSGAREMAAGTILACYPRAVRSHLDRLGLEAERLIDIRNHTADEALEGFGIVASGTPEVPETEAFRRQIEHFPVENGTDAWYPVIDKTRCTECGKCHDFCLFGVYEIRDKQVRVVRPQNCKNNCPACARVCPARAIIFPKYAKSPINGGTEAEETFDPGEMDKMYRERLQMRLQQRRSSGQLLKNNEV